MIFASTYRTGVNVEACISFVAAVVIVEELAKLVGLQSLLWIYVRNVSHQWLDRASIGWNATGTRIKTGDVGFIGRLHHYPSSLRICGLASRPAFSQRLPRCVLFRMGSDVGGFCRFYVDYVLVKRF